MSQAIRCPHCGHTAHTDKQIELGARVRCPKCKVPFQIEEPQEKIEKAVVHEEVQPPQDRESDMGSAFHTLNVDPDDAISTDYLAGSRASHAPGSDRRSLLDLPDEPWFYGMLWRYGQALKIIADVVTALLALCSLFGLISATSATFPVYTGFALGGFLASLLFIAFIWFMMRLASAAVLIVVDAARNIRYMASDKLRGLQ